jgi:hypothetical protein
MLQRTAREKLPPNNAEAPREKMTGARPEAGNPARREMPRMTSAAELRPGKGGAA